MKKSFESYLKGEHDVEARIRIAENYTSEVGEKMYQKFKRMPFPDAKMERLVHENSPKIRQSAGIFWQDQKKYTTRKYTFYQNLLDFFGVDWTYEYCDELGRTVRKYGVFLNNIENTATKKMFKGEANPVNVVEDKEQELEVLADLFSREGGDVTSL